MNNLGHPVSPFWNGKILGMIGISFIIKYHRNQQFYGWIMDCIPSNEIFLWKTELKQYNSFIVLDSSEPIT